VELVERACERPRPRRATQPTKASKERRLDAKRRRGDTKKTRQSREPGDE
jgi:ribosome-associated protein